MDINKKQGYLEPHETDGNNPNITIPKEHLKTQAESTNNCIDYPQKGTIENDKTFQYNTIEERIKNIDFRQIITEILEKEKTRQNAHIYSTQISTKQNERIREASRNTLQTFNLGPTTNDHNNKKEDLDSQQIETDTVSTNT